MNPYISAPKNLLYFSLFLLLTTVLCCLKIVYLIFSIYDRF